MRTILVTLLAGVAACGGDAADDGTADDTATDDVDVSDLTFTSCARGTDVGGFTVELADDFTGVQGQVMTGVVPSNVLAVQQAVTGADGDCVLVAAPELTCDPGCAVGETCGDDGTCIPYPTAVSVGDVMVRGMAVAFTMTPTAPIEYYTNPTTLPHPGFASGAGIALDAAGGDGAAFTLRGWGVAPLVPATDVVTVEDGVPLALAWDAPADAGPARVEITLNINGHGLVGSHVVCDVVDDGAFTVPDALVTALFADGVSGFPTMRMTRTTSDTAATAGGCIDLRVLSTRLLEVQIPGLVSCDDDTDCDAPQTCQPDLTCG